MEMAQIGYISCVSCTSSVNRILVCDQISIVNIGYILVNIIMNEWKRTQSLVHENATKLRNNITHIIKFYMNCEMRGMWAILIAIAVAWASENNIIIWPWSISSIYCKENYSTSIVCLFIWISWCWPFVLCVQTYLTVVQQQIQNSQKIMTIYLITPIIGCTRALLFTWGT